MSNTKKSTGTIKLTAGTNHVASTWNSCGTYQAHIDELGQTYAVTISAVTSAMVERLTLAFQQINTTVTETVNAFAEICTNDCFQDSPSEILDRESPVWYNENVGEDGLPRTTTKEPQMFRCQCGCGLQTRNRFAPGHDAKLKSRLLRAYRFGTQEERDAALAEASYQGWSHLMTDAPSRMAHASRTPRELHRKFGVEVECLVPSRERLAEAMRAEGLVVEVEGYNHRTRRHWKVVTDGSISGCPIGYQGAEVVSPPLSGPEGAEQVEKLGRALAAVGAKVNKSTGLHVHHHIPDLSAAHVTNLLVSYDQASDVETILAASRRRAAGNTYCAPISRQYNMTSILSTSYPPTSVEGIVAHQMSRYSVVNLQSFTKYGTVEFRQHGGTVEAAKILAWVQLTRTMVEQSKRGRFASLVEVTPAHLTGWVASRQAKLGTLAAQAA